MSVVDWLEEKFVVDLDNIDSLFDITEVDIRGLTHGFSKNEMALVYLFYLFDTGVYKNYKLDMNEKYFLMDMFDSFKNALLTLDFNIDIEEKWKKYN